jgi:hypothetical protein
METIRDFEDLLILLEARKARYLIIGGLAFTYHAIPRFTKDMDLWIDPAEGNVARVNQALAEFGSPMLLDPGDSAEILQLGVAPDRIDLIRQIRGARFETAWRDRIRSRYGQARANWIDLDGLIRIKRSIAEPRHQEDARILREVKRRQASRGPKIGARSRSSQSSGQK